MMLRMTNTMMMKGSISKTMSDNLVSVPVAGVNTGLIEKSKKGNKTLFFGFSS